MSGRRRWDRQRERDLTRDASDVKREDGMRVALAVSRIENARERDEVRHALAHPELHEAPARSLRGLLAWLEAGSGNTMSPRQRAWFERLQAVLVRDAAIRAKGGTPPAFVPDRGKCKHLARAKRQELPAWMNDPSLLPKRPPGAR